MSEFPGRPASFMVVQADGLDTVEDIMTWLHRLRCAWDSSYKLTQLYRGEDPSVIFADRSMLGSSPGVPSLRVETLRKQSPLQIALATAEVAQGLVVSGTAMGLMTYVIRNPAHAGGLLPTILASWHRQWADVSAAKRERAQALARENAHLLRTSANELIERETEIHAPQLVQEDRLRELDALRSEIREAAERAREAQASRERDEEEPMRERLRESERE